MKEGIPFFDEKWEAFLEELHDASERACATVGAAFCDDLLGRIFAAYFKGNPECYGVLLNPDNPAAPLGSFGARITAAYAIGMMGKEERDELRIISRIRNRFAHDLNPSFDNPDIAKLCRNLFVPNRKDITIPPNPTPRDLFHTSIYFISGGLGQRLQLLEEFEVSGDFYTNVRLAEQLAQAKAKNNVEG